MTERSCAHCAFCDTSEAVSEKIVGLCTHADNYMHGEFVAFWFAKGCPQFEPFALPQGDGDPGSEAA